MKLLHSADWHIDSPMLGHDTALRRALLEVPGKVIAAAAAEGCDLILLSGDLFDGNASPEGLRAVRQALQSTAIPVFIAPGNHDYIRPDSPWIQETWPEHVHIFTRETIESVALPALSCRVYGAAFRGPYSPALLEGFRAECDERYAVGVLHGDPTAAASPYCPITAGQVRQSGLDYLALGHIHKGDSFREGDTLCAWPGCPMGRGFDELGPKGVLIVTLDGGSEARFLPLDTPRFFRLTAEAGADPENAIRALLPPVGNDDHYQIELTGESEPLELSALQAKFSHFPHLELRDSTLPPIDLWAGAGEDSLEGVYFGMLRSSLEGQDEETRQRVLLAARISRQLLLGQEVDLP